MSFPRDVVARTARKIGREMKRPSKTYCGPRARLVPPGERGRSVEQRGRRGPLSAEHHAALVSGEHEHRIVRRYLEFLRFEHGHASSERDFVAVAASFGRRFGIDYASWREVGVSDDVLRRAAIDREAPTPHDSR